MKVIKGEDYAEISSIVANIIVDEVKQEPECVLGLATGGEDIYFI